MVCKVSAGFSALIITPTARSLRVEMGWLPCAAEWAAHAALLSAAVAIVTIALLKLISHAEKRLLSLVPIGSELPATRKGERAEAEEEDPHVRSGVTVGF